MFNVNFVGRCQFYIGLFSCTECEYLMFCYVFSISLIRLLFFVLLLQCMDGEQNDGKVIENTLATMTMTTTPNHTNTIHCIHNASFYPK